MTKACAWCGEPSIKEAEIEPPIRGTKKFLVIENGKAKTKTSKIKKRSITAPVCELHAAMVERNLTEKAARRG